jgi:hypothetical protein
MPENDEQTTRNFARVPINSQIFKSANENIQSKQTNQIVPNQPIQTTNQIAPNQPIQTTNQIAPFCW